MLYATFLYMQGLIEFTLSTGYIIGPAVGGGLNEVRNVGMHLCICMASHHCACVTLEL